MKVTGEPAEPDRTVTCSLYVPAATTTVVPGEVRAAEKDYAANGKWWHDTAERAWVVKRPFAPGVIDSTHLFEVSYRVEGTEVGRWLVDTRKGSVDKVDLRRPANP